MQKYLIVVWHDIEASIEGPFPNEEARLDRAREIRQGTDPDQGVLPGSFDVLEAAQDVPLVATQSLSQKWGLGRDAPYFSTGRDSPRVSV